MVVYHSANPIVKPMATAQVSKNKWFRLIVLNVMGNCAYGTLRKNMTDLLFLIYNEVIIILITLINEDHIRKMFLIVSLYCNHTETLLFGAAPIFKPIHPKILTG